MRYLLAAIPAVFLLSACGGGSDKGGTTPGASAQPATPTTVAGQQPTAEDRPLPTPTPVPEDGIAVQVAGVSGAPYAPKLSELKALPTAEISFEGKSYKGISLATLLAKVNAPETATVTVDGTRPDGKRQGAVRFALKDIGDSTVLVLGNNGELNVASTSIPKDQWLIWVTGISIR